MVVEVAGVEPASPELLVGLLRAQPMIDLGRAAGHRRSAVAQSSLGVPAGPEALPASEPLSMTHRPSERRARRGRATQFSYAAIAMLLSLAFVVCVGSLTTFRQR